jgi:hypothetical protein
VLEDFEQRRGVTDLQLPRGLEVGQVDDL